MTSTRTLVVLGVAAAALTVGAVVVTTGAPESGGETSGPMVEGLVDSLDEVRQVIVEQGERRATYMRQDDGSWLAGSVDGYPVMFEQLKGALIGLAMLEREEARTAEASRHDRLDLDWPDADGRARLVHVYTTGETPMASVVLGKRDAGRSALYARMKDSDQTYRCSGDAAFEADPTRWMDRLLVAAPPSAIDRVDSAHLVLVRDGDEWTAQPGPGGEVEAEAAESARVTLPNLLTRLEFANVRARTPDPWPDEFHVAYKAGDGGVVVSMLPAEGGAEAEEVWIRLDPIGLGAPAEGGAAPAWFDKPDWRNWEYALPGWRARPMIDLMEAAPMPEEFGPPAPDPAESADPEVSPGEAEADDAGPGPEVEPEPSIEPGG